MFCVFVVTTSIFALLLIYFEVGLGKYEDFIRKYFGFMFSYVGRSIFTLLYLLSPRFTVVTSPWSSARVTRIRCP